MATLAGLVPCAVSAVMTTRRCVGLAAVGEVRAHEHEAGELTLRAGGRLERDRVEPAHLGEDLLEAPHELERALRGLLLLVRMEVAEARQVDDPLVHARVVLHRAGAERVEARVDAEVAVGESREVADELGLRDLGQPRRLPAGELLRDLRLRQLVARQRAGATARLRLLEDQLHPATSPSTSASRSMSSGRPLLRDGDEQRVVEARRSRARARSPDARPGPARSRTTSFALRPTRTANSLNVAWSGNTSGRPRPLLRVLAKAHAGLPQLAEPLRAEPRQMDEAGERQQRLVRRDVRRRLLAPDVLLARLQGEDVAALARGGRSSRRRSAPASVGCSRSARRGSRSAGRRTTGSCRRPGPRRSRARSRTHRAPRARRARRDRRARPASAPASFAAAARSGAGSRQPKKFGCWKITHAASAAASPELVGVGDAAAVARPRRSRGRTRARRSSRPGAPAGSASRRGRPCRGR